MPKNSPHASPHNSTRWWPAGNHQVSVEEESFSFSPSQRLSCNSNIISFVSDIINNNDAANAITLDIDEAASRSSSMSMAMPFSSGNTTPDIRRKIEMASPKTAKSIAINMYEAMKKHGLREEIRTTVFERDSKAAKGDDEEEASSETKKSIELLGMEYLMRDGIVTYLRNAAQVTPPIPHQVIRFYDVQYSRKFKVPSNEYETFGNKLVGCFTEPLRKLLREEEDYVWQDILKGIDGYIMPGSMTLLLGPPGCGKSTLLTVLAGRAETKKNAQLDGVVMYNNKYAAEVNLSRIIAYISGQLDKHLPFLTVKETLEFARDCSQTLRPENFTPQMRKFFAQALVEGQDPFLEYILEILDLKSIEDKLAGESISDIDRQKLTIAELALGTYPVMLYDQPLSGSDTAVTYHLVNTVRTVSRIQQSSAIMSLAQVSQEIFYLFDRIILLGSGQVIFQGPRQDVIPYFYKLGYTKPTYVESAEFLEDIVAGFGSQYRAPGASNLSIDELIKCYRESDHYKDIIRIVKGGQAKHTYWVESEPGLGLSIKTHASRIAEPRMETELEITKISTKVSHSGGIESTGKVQVGDVVTAISINREESIYLALGSQSTKHEHVSHAYSTLKKAEGQIRIQVERYQEKEEGNLHKWKESQRTFSQTWWKSTKTLVDRQKKITKRLRVLLVLRLLQATVLGLFTGTLFYQLGGQYDPRKMNSIRALGFVSTMSIMLLNLVQLPLYMLQRPIFYKHKAQNFFRTSSYVAAHAIVNIPQTLVEATVYTICIFFLVGLTGSVAGFFEYLFLLFLVAYFGSSVFFFLSAISSLPEVGNALAGLLVSILLLFSGFVIYPSKIPTYWKWFTYINPIHWANVSYCRLQFQNYSDQCSKHQGQLPFCDQLPSMTVGKAYLVFNELYQDSLRPYFQYAIVIGWTVLVIMMVLLGLKTLEFPSTNQSLPYLKSSPTIRTFSRDESDASSVVSQEGNVDKLSANTGDSEKTGIRKENIASTPHRARGEGRLDSWMEDFHIDMGRCGLGLSVEPVSLVFEELSFNMFNKETNETTAIFSHITGYCNPGNMLAVLGGSQATKSTLLKCLAGRIPISSDLHGDIQANGMKPGDTFFQLIGYAEKLDAHQPFLSVRESLQFSAALRLKKGIDSRSRSVHVELILAKLDLLAYANQLVGSLHDATGKTFEIAKKMTIAVELAANPSMLFLEEPIYGLDSIGISNILNILSQLSASGMNIIATLTHPNVRSLVYFDHTLILTRAGEQAYFGPTGANCADLISYFLSLPSSPKHLIGENPISFVMELLGQGIKSRGMLSLNFAKTYKVSSLHEQINKEISTIKNLYNGREQKDLFFTYTAPYTRQAALVLLRTQRLFWRNVQYTYGRLTVCMLIGLLMGSLYFQIEYKDLFGVTSRTLYIYMQAILIGVISANNVIPQIGTDRLVYLRERRAGMYLPVFYPISWVVGEIPYFFFACLVMAGIGNGLAGIATRSLTEFLYYWFVLFVFTLCLTYFGMMVTFLAPMPIFAAFFVSIVTSLWVSASGVVVVLSDIKFYRWMYWSNPFQYALSALTSISFYCNTKDCELDCKCQRLPDGSYVWDQLATARNLSNSRINIDILILAAMCILFVSFAFLFFTKLKHNKRT